VHPLQERLGSLSDNEEVLLEDMLLGIEVEDALAGRAINHEEHEEEEEEEEDAESVDDEEDFEF